ncbi:hypothetical protein MOX02_08310 [Methylobacterium oxalidis]|uniref:UPF0260 protein GCM10007888_51900 n=2 Tax=Methylobacterium oxalidis TaxID=944322 RepID=A0A512IYR3_9HYPH|nr:hypothetical protein MOX02_08310 [Methylobacterium oxalidis]GJE33780.1 hypothetical protein LDDCCGHA_3983 [Methylobacterium oxalidis]GLS66807.1 hypothetical protein GCM10007888_51900 [Methylobacterium oxalidis]
MPDWGAAVAAGAAPSGLACSGRRLAAEEPEGPARAVRAVLQTDTRTNPMGESRAPRRVRADAAEPFWRRKSLDAMTQAEWESLCDGCGRCCLIKLEDEDTGVVHHTDIGCTLLDGIGCRCRDYARRQKRVPDCVRLTPEAVRTIPWLPPTCAYRLVRDGLDLYDWHPLVSGRAASVHEAGISVRGRLSGNEEEFSEEEFPERIVAWPGLRPGEEEETE